MATYELNITLYEGGHTQPVTLYSPTELETFVDAIEDLWSPTYLSTRAFRVLMDDNDGSLSIVYKDMNTGECLPIPETWLRRKIDLGRRRNVHLVGDRIPIAPRQSHAFDFVEVTFTKA